MPTDGSRWLLASNFAYVLPNVPLVYDGRGAIYQLEIWLYLGIAMFSAVHHACSSENISWCPEPDMLLFATDVWAGERSEARRSLLDWMCLLMMIFYVCMRYARHSLQCNGDCIVSWYLSYSLQS